MVFVVCIVLILAQNGCFKISMRRNIKQAVYDHLNAICSLEDVLRPKIIDELMISYQQELEAWMVRLETNSFHHL